MTVCWKSTESDWQFGEEGSAGAGGFTSRERYRVKFDSANVEIEVPAEGVLVSVRLPTRMFPWVAMTEFRFASRHLNWSTKH
jgi:hypothetical protein